MNMIGSDYNPYDFFGVRRKNNKSVSYLGLTPIAYKKKVPKLAVVNFIGKPTPFSPRAVVNRKTDYWGKVLYKKESIKQKHLSKWGDVDMDGSPNYFDCDPVDWLKDAKKKNPKKINKFTSGTTEVSKEDVMNLGKKASKEVPLQQQIAAAIKSGRPGRRRLSREEKVSKARKVTEETIRRFAQTKKGTLKGTKLAQAEFAAEESIARGKVPKAKYIKKIAEARQRQIFTMAPSTIPVVTEGMQKLEKKKKELVVPYKTETELKGLRKDADIKLQAYENEYMLKHRRAPTKREVEKFKQTNIKELYEYEKATSPEKMKEYEGKKEVIRMGMARERKIGEELARHAESEKAKEERRTRIEGMEEGVKRVLTGRAAIDALKRIEIHPEAVVERAKEIAKATPKALTATYGKEERAATRKVQRLVKGGLSSVFGGSLLQTKFGPAIRGRPSGPSGKYMIEGKPVYEEEYSKYATQQKALNRLTPSTTQQAPLTPEEQAIPQAPPTEEQQGYPTETKPLTAEEIQQTKTIQSPTRGPTSEEIKLAQEMAQQQDNVLNAPSFMKGELKATGGSLLTPTGPQIMDAPNAFKGQLRTLNRGGEVPAVRLSERPQTNPYGDEYVDIELGSGKPVLKKRPREKWMTGEAL